jgi:multimeric flavodoxin WrbA
MHKVEIFLGSPRKKGNTQVLSTILIDKLDKEKVKTNTCFLYGYEIKPCVDCRGCKRGELKCILKDDMDQIYSKIECSEIIVFGSPIYWFGISAKTKLLIDRLRPYYVNKKLNGKKGALLLSAGSGESDCDLTIEMFKRVFNTLGIEFIGAVIAKAYDIGDAERDTIALNSISKLAGLINSLS